MNRKCHNSQFDISEKQKHAQCYTHMTAKLLEYKSNNKKSFVSTTNFMQYKMMPQFNKCHDDWSWRVLKSSKSKRKTQNSRALQFYFTLSTKPIRDRANDSNSGRNNMYRTQKHTFVGVLKAWAMCDER